MSIFNDQNSESVSKTYGLLDQVVNNKRIYIKNQPLYRDL